MGKAQVRILPEAPIEFARDAQMDWALPAKAASVAHLLPAVGPNERWFSWFDSLRGLFSPV